MKLKSGVRIPRTVNVDGKVVLIFHDGQVTEPKERECDDEVQDKDTDRHKDKDVETPWTVNKFNSMVGNNEHRQQWCGCVCRRS